MIRFFHKLFNHDKIADMQRTLDIYKERNSQLEKENMEYKGYKLKYEVTKLYVEDDDALLELFDIAKKHDAEMNHRQMAMMNRNNALAQGQFSGMGHGQFGMTAGLGTTSGMFGGLFI